MTPGTQVIVKTPHGEKSGVIIRVLPGYAWTGRTKYLIRGSEIETITSKDFIREVENGTN